MEITPGVMMQLPQSPPAAAYSKSQTVTELSNYNTVTFQNLNSIFFLVKPEDYTVNQYVIKQVLLLTSSRRYYNIH